MHFFLYILHSYYYIGINDSNLDFKVPVIFLPGRVLTKIVPMLQKIVDTVSQSSDLNLGMDIRTISFLLIALLGYVCMCVLY